MAEVLTACRMAEVLTAAGRLPVVTLGRLAGQCAKPRSAPLDALGLPSYPGDIVNAVEVAAEARVPDSDRILRAHVNSSAAMAGVRALTATGAAGPPRTGRLPAL